MCKGRQSMVTFIDWKAHVEGVETGIADVSRQTLVTPIDWKHHHLSAAPGAPALGGRQSLVTLIDWKPHAASALPWPSLQVANPS